MEINYDDYKSMYAFAPGQTVWSKDDGRRGVVINLAGRPDEATSRGWSADYLSYFVRFENPDLTEQALGGNYYSQASLSGKEVTLETEPAKILAKLSRNDYTSNREKSILVNAHLADYVYDDPQSNRPTGIVLRSNEPRYPDDYKLSEEELARRGF